MSNVGGLGGGNYGNYGLDYGAGPSPEALQYGQTLQTYCRQVGQALAERYQELRSGNPTQAQRSQIESEIQTLIGNLDTAEGYAAQCGLNDLAHEIDRLGGTASSAWNPLAGPNGQGGLPPYSQVLSDKILVEAPPGRSLDPINVSRRLDQHPVYIYGQNPQLNIPGSANATVTQETVGGRTMYKIHVTFQPDGREQDYYTAQKPTLNVEDRSQISGNSSLYNITTANQRNAVEEFVGDAPDEVNGDETVWNTNDHVRYYFDGRRFVDSDGLTNPDRVDVIDTDTLDLNLENRDQELYITRLANGQYDIEVHEDGKTVGHIRTENVQNLNLRGVPQANVHYRDGVSSTPAATNPSPANPPLQDRAVPNGIVSSSETINTTGPLQIRTTNPEDKVWVVPVGDRYVVTIARGGDQNNTHTYTVLGPPSEIHILANEDQKIQPWPTGPAMERVNVNQIIILEELPPQPTPSTPTENEYVSFTNQDSTIHFTARGETSPARNTNPTTGAQEFTVNLNDTTREHRTSSTGVVNIRVPDANTQVHWSTDQDGSIIIEVSQGSDLINTQRYIFSGPPSRINIIANENQRGLVSGDPALTSRIHIGPNAAAPSTTNNPSQVSSNQLPQILQTFLRSFPGITPDQLMQKIGEFFPEVANLDGQSGVTIAELNLAINQHLFPPQVPNAKMARLLLSLDHNLSASLAQTNTTDTAQYTTRMNAVTQRVVTLLNSLYNGNITQCSNNQFTAEARAGLMTINGTHFQLFGSGLNTYTSLDRVTQRGLNSSSNTRGQVYATSIGIRQQTTSGPHGARSTRNEVTFTEL